MTGKNFKVEYEKQDEALKKLGDNYTFPLFSTKFAIESSRRTAYKDTASAAQEIVDNSIEAGASNIHVIFDQEAAKKKGKKKKNVSKIAFIDNGAGMSPRMLRFALSWGGGVHHDNPDFIGKFGFGLPNSSVNQTRLTQVYSRRAGEKKWMVCTLDIDNLNDSHVVEIPEPISGNLPEFVKNYVDRNKINLESGTIVVWIKPDRLTYQRVSSLKEHLVERFGIVYRYLIKNTNIIVQAVKVNAIDPLFLSPEGRYYRDPSDGGAQLGFDKEIVAKYWRDPDTNEPRFEKVEDTDELPDVGDRMVSVGTIHVKTGWFPFGLIVDTPKRRKPWSVPIDEYSEKRMGIRVNGRRGISFVRAGREIENADIFPRGIKDKESKMGDWPVLQSYALHYGVEVRMDPDLDEVFGITNDKQGIRPIPDFWRLLASEGLDDHLKRLNKDVINRFQDANAEWKQKQIKEISPTPTPAERAAATAERALGKKPNIPDNKLEEVQKKEELAAKERVEKEGLPVTEESIQKAKEAIRKEGKFRPYITKFEDNPRGPFYRPDWGNREQKVVIINRAHPFFKTLYLSIVKEGGGMAKNAVDALMICLAKAELIAQHEELQFFYETQREQVWSQEIEIIMKSLLSQEANEEPDVELE